MIQLPSFGERGCPRLRHGGASGNRGVVEASLISDRQERGPASWETASSAYPQFAHTPSASRR